MQFLHRARRKSSLIAFGTLTLAIATGLAAQVQPEARRSAWQWSETDRYAARDAYVRQKQAEHRTRHPSSEAKATILGSATPELIFPIELFDRLLRIGLNADRAGRDVVRQDMEARASQAGLTLPAGFWDSLEAGASAYLRSKTEVDRLAGEVEGSTARERAAIDRQIRAEKAKQCAYRAEALALARDSFGRDFVDRFLYSSVAPTMFVTVIGQPELTPAELERGCK